MKREKRMEKLQESVRGAVRAKADLPAPDDTRKGATDRSAPEDAWDILRRIVW